MKFCLITFRSVTPAQRGERILNRAGIVAALSRTPKWMEQQGCGYYLKLRTEDCRRAVALLLEKQVRFRKVYRQLTDAVEEVEAL